MSDYAPTPASSDTGTVAEAGWEDTPDYPHRIENHVKVYLHLEEPPPPVVAAPDSVPAGTRVYRRSPDGEAQYGTVTGWTTDGTGVFVSFDQAGTYAGPTFRSIFVAPAEEARAAATGSRWAVSGVTVDGYPLDGVEDGHYCDYEGHPPGARPDWDRQHREAAHVHLPTAEELLPLLATALGTSLEGPTVEQLRAASDLIAEHAQWRSERADLSAGESTGDFPAAFDWHDSDDGGCDLADRAIALLAEVTGQQDPADAPSPAGGPGVALMRSTLAATPPASTTRPEPGAAATSQPHTGPAR